MSTSPNERFRRAWLWLSGLACIGLPYLWWPRPFSSKSLLHAVVFITVLGLAILGGKDGGVFDHKRAPIRGYAGVAAFVISIFGSVFAYRWYML